jgi:hypothetical protein
VLSFKREVGSDLAQAEKVFFDALRFSFLVLCVCFLFLPRLHQLLFLSPCFRSADGLRLARSFCGTFESRCPVAAERYFAFQVFSGPAGELRAANAAVSGTDRRNRTEHQLCRRAEALLSSKYARPEIALSSLELFAFLAKDMICTTLTRI